MNTIPLHHLQALKISARLSVGFVWLWEGLMPKVLHPSQTQFDMVLSSGWWWGSPEATLYWLGMAQIIAGIILMSGLWEKLGQVVATVSVIVMMFLVIGNHPSAVHDPFGGLAKDACLFTCSAVVMLLSGKTRPREAYTA